MKLMRAVVCWQLLGHAVRGAGKRNDKLNTRSHAHRFMRCATIVFSVVNVAVGRKTSARQSEITASPKCLVWWRSHPERHSV